MDLAERPLRLLIDNIELLRAGLCQARRGAPSSDRAGGEASANEFRSEAGQEFSALPHLRATSAKAGAHTSTALAGNGWYDIATA